MKKRDHAAYERDVERAEPPAVCDRRITCAAYACFGAGGSTLAFAIAVYLVIRFLKHAPKRGAFHLSPPLAWANATAAA